MRVGSWCDVRVLGWVLCVCSVGSWCDVRVLGWAPWAFLAQAIRGFRSVVAIQIVSLFCYILRLISRHTIFHRGAQPGQYGFAVQNTYPQRKTTAAAVKAMDEITDADSFTKAFNQPLPKWWPRKGNGKIVKYLYRLLDGECGSDLQNPADLDPAIRHYVQEEKPVNFFDPDIKEQALRHVTKINELRVSDRPFVSTSFSLDAVVSFGKHKRKGINCQIVRFDLLEMWGAGLFTETSFADLSEENRFVSDFQTSEDGGRVDIEWAQEHGINVVACKSPSVHLEEIMIGPRGPWWHSYALLVSDDDAVLASQVGGYGKTSFGSETMNKYKAVPPGANAVSYKFPYFAVPAAPTRPVPMVTSEASSSSDVSKRSIPILPPAKPPSPAPSAKSPRAATPPAPATPPPPATAPPPATQLQSATAPSLLEPPAPTTPPNAEVPHYVIVDNHQHRQVHRYEHREENREENRCHRQ